MAMLNIVDATEERLTEPDATPVAAAIRACTPGDLPAVAGLFRKTFPYRYGGEEQPLEPYLERIFFHHPWQDPDINSLVYVGADGAVSGFVGVIPLRLLVNGVPRCAAMAGTFMVDRPAENPTAGARLVRQVLAGPQDLTITESANQVSRRMWDTQGARPLAAYGMEWLRLLRPAGFAVARLAERASAARVLSPFAKALDAAAGRLGANPFRLDRDKTHAGIVATDVADPDIIEHIIEFAKDYPLRPDWDRASLAWFLDNAAVKQRYGALHRRVVAGRNGKLAGCYLYYGRPGGMGFVLQMLARPGQADRIVDDLLAHADRNGIVALRGRTQPEFADALLRRRAVFLHVASTLVHTRDETVLAAFKGHDALVTGLAGEAWSRLIGGTFS